MLKKHTKENSVWANKINSKIYLKMMIIIVARALVSSKIWRLNTPDQNYKVLDNLKEWLFLRLKVRTFLSEVTITKIREVI